MLKKWALKEKKNFSNSGRGWTPSWKGGSYPYLYDKAFEEQGKGCSWKCMEKIAAELDFIEDVKHSGFSCVFLCLVLVLLFFYPDFY